MRIHRLSIAALLAGALAGPVLAQTAETAPPPPAPPVSTPPSEWRTVPVDNLMVIDTTKGRVLVELTPEIAPLHVERMRLLARAGFFDGLTWHRVIDQFMAQTGDPWAPATGSRPIPT